MKNENVFMSRKKQYGEHPKSSRLRPLRPKSDAPRPTLTQRQDQRRKDKGLGRAWWETISKYMRVAR